LYLGPKEKDSVPVDGIIAIIGKKGESYEHLLNGDGDSKEAPKAEEAPAKAPEKQEAPAQKVDLSSIPAEVITMPKMSDTMAEGVIASWLVKVGDTVKSGDILAEVETDKATMELENYTDGTVLYLAVEAGKSVPVDGIIAIVGEKGTDYKPLLQQNGQQTEEAPKAAPAAEKAPAEKSAVADKVAPEVQPVVETAQGGRVKVSPLAKKLAKEMGYDLQKIKGTGDQGRIVKKDVENFKPEQAKTPAPAKQEEKAYIPAAVQVGKESFHEETVSQMRKTIARRLSESKYTAPHFYLTMEINMDKAVEARESLNAISPVKLSFNDLVIKAAAAALRQHPKVNSSWLGDKIRYNEHIHIGVAVAVPEGLLVPVVRFADSKSLSQISAEVKALGQKAKDKKLQPSDWEGNTFTISNLGMFGIEEFTAIINTPEACIMAVGGIKQVPVVKNGEIKVGNVMKVTLSCDHRVVDGAIGAAFLQTFKQLLEDPVRILV
jgi:pyruvate dehydrogenase E2 component (dihydrolipoamide acetyltransferase)